MADKDRLLQAGKKKDRPGTETTTFDPGNAIPPKKDVHPDVWDLDARDLYS